MRMPAVVGVVVCVASAGLAQAGGIDPRGVYHNVFEGSFDGTEWFQVNVLPGENRYRVADIFGGGFDATITPGGVITLDSGVGGGAFTDADNWEINPSIAGIPFTFDNARAPDTTPDFPLQLVSRAPSNALLSDAWTSVTEELNPRSGGVISSVSETVTTTSASTAFRITAPDGGYFQGVFETPTTVIFRFILPGPVDPRYANFVGSELSGDQNMVGRATIEGANAWSAIILLQSRTALGSQTQRAIRYTATRAVPLAPGDVDGDGDVDDVDRANIEAQLGLNATNDGYNIAADLNGDGVIDELDVAAFDALTCPADLDADGAVEAGDLAVVLAAWGTPGADLTGDGTTDAFDLAVLLAGWGECAASR